MNTPSTQIFANFLTFWLHLKAYAILVPQPWIKPVSPAREAQSLNKWTTKGNPKYCFLNSILSSVQFSPWVMSNSVTPWTAACQSSLSITNSQSLLKFMSIESAMPSNHLILFIPFSSHLQSCPASGSFQISQFFPSGGQSIGVSASASVLPMNIQEDWFPLGWTGLISWQSKRLSRVYSNTTVQKHQFFSTHFSL